jgi:pimeloyl-ACP methyl ester carboxylesterase
MPEAPMTSHPLPPRGDVGLWRAALALVFVAVASCGGDNDSQGPPADEGEPVVAGCHDGTQSETGALYRVCYPSSWNGGLVVYAHGYVSSSEPLAVPDDQVEGQSVAQLVTGLGYAYAATSYRANGLVADVAVEDVAQLVQEVKRRFQPDPSRAFVVGVSEGGLVAALATEQHTDQFAGGLAACGPVGDFVAQIDYFGDFRVVFDYFFPGVIPGPPLDVPDAVRAAWNSTYAPAVVTALQANPAATLQLLSVTSAPYDPANISTIGETVLGVLWYDIFALPDARGRLGGQPYDNTGRVYEGSLNDAALNAGVARVSADASARDGLARFQTSGAISLPLVTLHTTGDPIVPVTQEALYADKVVGHNASSLLDSRSVSRYGHCAFHASELLDAFASLVARTDAATFAY